MIPSYFLVWIRYCLFFYSFRIAAIGLNFIARIAGIKPAAIGIANTMMMSIYERTKEIGVMKVLGCDMGNIRSMFLIESGFIGFMGGVLGALLSYGVSVIVNRFVSMSDMMGMSGNLSRIPLWLAFAAIGFAVFVGMAAGFMPAMRAMKLSQLAAIRNE